MQWLRTEVVKSEESEQAARARALRDYQVALDAMHARLNLLYEDRLDRRIDAVTYDRKAKETRQQQDRSHQDIQNAQAITLAPSSHAIGLMIRASEAAETFSEQAGEEQRRFVQLVVKGGRRGRDVRCRFKSHLRNYNFRTP